MKLYLAIFCASAVALLNEAAPADVFNGDLPLQNPDLFGGDMLGVELDERNAIASDYLRWTGRVVPFQIDYSLMGYRSMIINAMNHYHSRTCIRFKERTSERNYVRIMAGQGCYSYVGMTGGAQVLSLGQGCLNNGIIIHELGHAVGFYHEHMRSDRDSYIIIYWQNIQSGMNDQFTKLQNHENRLLDTFDYNSIMLYGSISFSKDNRSWTMAKRNGGHIPEVFQKSGLSASDVKRIQKLYQC